MDIDRIRKIQDNSKSNEAQEIVNSKLQENIDKINTEITGKLGTRVYIDNKLVNKVDFTSDPQEQINKKQDKLIGTQTTGQNIKTLNGTSLLGSGNIDIPKGDKGEDGDLLHWRWLSKLRRI